MDVTEEIDDMKEEEMEEDDIDDEESSESSGDEVSDDEDIVNKDLDKDDTATEPESKPKAFIPGKEELGEGEELVMDDQAYTIYHQASLGPPCLSFDIIPDHLGNDRADSFPMTIYGVAGTQATKMSANSVIVFKMHNLHPIKRKVKENEDDDSDEDSDDDDDDAGTDPEKEPKLKIAALKHNGCINRIRFKTIGDTSLAAAWSEQGSVGIWSLDHCMQKVEQPGGNTEKDQREATSPLFNFKGHQTEGFAMNWSPTMPGVLATGDCKKDIYVWKPSPDAASWSIGKPLKGHTASVEDIIWSPNEANVLASCSVDKSIRIWDCRANPDRANMLTAVNAHNSDVNVIDWNPNEPFLASGGDDNMLKIWDLRSFDKGIPVATFKHHTQPVTSVEWHPKDFSVLASSGADNQIALWDLAIEQDPEQEKNRENSDEELKDVPPQLLFIHQGMQDVKELHWHKQIPGLLTATSQTGFDVFRTISV